MKGNYLAKFKYNGVAEIPFTDLLDDPLLVLRNLPRVDTIELCGDLDYKVRTTPFVFHSAIQVVGVGHVNLDVIDGVVTWDQSPHHCDEECNGIITGTARDDGNGHILLDGEIGIRHPYITRITWPFVSKLAQDVGDQIMREFIENFNDPAHENFVPE